MDHYLLMDPYSSRLGAIVGQVKGNISRYGIMYYSTC
jgi:hypothetical protein